LSSLSEESHLAGKVKKEQPILVVLGNPPYSGISANINEWTERLLKDDLNGAQSYYKMDGQPLGEKNPKWLQDDYVKFLRFAQWKIEKAGFGVVGMITNHSYLDNPTFRGMRQSLTRTFNEIYILDLHGNTLKKETAPDGGKDENVFDIRQGVAIAVFVKQKDKKRCAVYHKDLYGLREEKYRWLFEHEFHKKNYTRIKPQSPYYFFIKRQTSEIQHYLKWKKVNEIFPVNSVGRVTSRDDFVMHFDEKSLEQKILQFRNLNTTDSLIAEAFNLKDKKNWTLSKVRSNFAKEANWKDYIEDILYRPFDIRKICYYEEMIERPRSNVMRHMLDGENLGLIFHKREELQISYAHFLITDNIIEHGSLSSKTTCYLAPLHLYPDNEKNNLRPGVNLMMVFEPQAKYVTRKPNIDPEIYEELEKNFGKKPTPEEILYYIYGVFYSDTYRTKYAEFLKIDFPRVPFTSNYEVFKKVAAYGKQLADLHLLKSKALDKPMAKYRGSGDNDRIETIKYDAKANCVYINQDKHFDGVAPELWNYHIGGYQVLHKFLKDRKGRIMDDSRHYSRVVTAISKTIALQKQIDGIYNQIEKEVIEFTNTMTG
jgi:predicted helicase